MFAATMSAALVGVEPRPVRVEAHVGRPREGFLLVGLPDTAVREAKDRVRAAVTTSSYPFPTRRVTVSLAPASLPKAGSAFDLPIALGVLAASGEIPEAACRVVALGELALDGAIRPARGALAAAMVAARLGLPCLVPRESAAEAAAVPDAEVRVVASLSEAVSAAQGNWTGSNPISSPTGSSIPGERGVVPDLSDVRGQPIARRALEIAGAGGHHLLLVGPPGCGKTMLARRLPGLLPRLTSEAALEVACVWSAADRHREFSDLPPFRSPHHSASAVALLGGGSGVPVPGELALAHQGVLFLDELGEFPVNVLESLRQPLEEGSVTVARKGYSVRYPAEAQVVAATNPCPCGHAGDRVVSCRCPETTVARYRRRLSGPLLDRFDLQVRVGRPDLASGTPGEPTVAVAERVLEARHRQLARGRLNRQATGEDLDARIAPGATAMLLQAVDRGVLSGRGYDRVRRVSCTIADLAGREMVTEEDAGEALGFRGGW